MIGVETLRHRPRLIAPVAVLGGFLAGLAVVTLVDPSEPGHYPTCPFLFVTGYYCPGCGSLRMFHALTHGHLSEGFARNPLAFVTMIGLGYVWVRWAVAAHRGVPLRSRLFRPWVIGVFTAVTLVYWVVRNLPFGHALAP